ncbi:MAG TPA: hypothetical protein VGN16_24840 [Acidobacteriaceae bacterium]|jgi:hypothetical protein
MPSVTIWNRLEPRARTSDLAAGLAARVHDPLWLLARQWQVGEFAGRDAGSPLTAQVQWTTAPFDRYASGSAAPLAYDGTQPIETLIERESVRPPSSAVDLHQAAEAGLHFLRLLDAANLTRLRPAYFTQYALKSATASDADSQKMSAVVTGRVIDGVKLRADLALAGAGKLPPLPAFNTTDAAAVLPITQAFTTWFDSLFSQPTGATSWSPQRMEYSFSIAATADPGSLIAQEYDGGEVDWYTFDHSTAALAEPGTAPAAPAPATRTVIVAPVTFRGMPARRFWEMEDAAVDIGALTAAAEDLGRLLLREFALIYGNDWFQIPLAVPVGSQVVINALNVADTFGIITKVPHYAAADGLGAPWRMFSLGATGGPVLRSAADNPANLLVIPPSAVASLDSVAIEDVLFLRDELAEMVWGVERTAVGPSGLPTDRSLAWKTSAPPVPPPSVDAPPAYRLGTTVPDYWIPFLPVDVDTGPLQMRRGRLPTAASGPMGQFLNYPAQTIPLEELPQEGVHLERVYRYARGTDGSTHLWIGRRRTTGLGEGRSGLRFDILDS